MLRGWVGLGWVPEKAEVADIEVQNNGKMYIYIYVGRAHSQHSAPQIFVGSGIYFLNRTTNETTKNETEKYDKKKTRKTEKKNGTEKRNKFHRPLKLPVG